MSLPTHSINTLTLTKILDQDHNHFSLPKWSCQQILSSMILPNFLWHAFHPFWFPMSFREYGCHDWDDLSWNEMICLIESILEQQLVPGLRTDCLGPWRCRCPPRFVIKKWSQRSRNPLCTCGSRVGKKRQFMANTLELSTKGVPGRCLASQMSKIGLEQARSQRSLNTGSFLSRS